MPPVPERPDDENGADQPENYDQGEDAAPQVRRVTPKDRKTRLTSGPLFPADDSPLPDDATIMAEAEAGSPFDRAVSLPDADDDAEATPDTSFDAGEPPERDPTIEAQRRSRGARHPDRAPGDYDLLYPDTSAIEGISLREKLQPPAERYPPLAFSDDDAAAAPPRPAAAPVPGADEDRKRPAGDWRHNLIALVFLLATVGLIVIFTWLWNNPYNPDNPFALATPFRVVTETPDALALLNAQATATAQAQPTPTPTAPPVSISGLPFVLDETGVRYNTNDNGSGCDWASISGAVRGLEGEALNGYRVRITDAADPAALDVEVFSGALANLGDGAFEYVLGNAPRAGRYDVQLFSAAGAPVSDPYRIVTRATCTENVASVTFVQIEPI